MSKASPRNVPGLQLGLPKPGKISHNRTRSANFYPHTERVQSHISPRGTFKRVDCSDAAYTARGSVGITIPANIPTIISDKRIVQSKKTFNVFSSNFAEMEADPVRKFTQKSNFHHQDLDKNATLKDVQKFSNLARIRIETKKKAGKMFVTDLWSQKHIVKVRHASGIEEEKEKIALAKRNPAMQKLKVLEQYFGRRHTQEAKEVESWVQQLENAETIKIFDETLDMKSPISTQEQSLQNDEYSLKHNISGSKHQIDLNPVQEESVGNADKGNTQWFKSHPYKSTFLSQRRLPVRSIPIQPQLMENHTPPSQVTSLKQIDSSSKAMKGFSTSNESEVQSQYAKFSQKQRGSLSDISTAYSRKQSRSRSLATLDHLPSMNEISSGREEGPSNSSRFMNTMNWILGECDKQTEKKVDLSPKMKNNFDRLLATQHAFREKLRFYKIRRSSGDGHHGLFHFKKN